MMKAYLRGVLIQEISYYKRKAGEWEDFLAEDEKKSDDSTLDSLKLWKAVQLTYKQTTFLKAKYNILYSKRHFFRGGRKYRTFN